MGGQKTFVCFFSFYLSSQNGGMQYRRNTFVLDFGKIEFNNIQNINQHIVVISETGLDFFRKNIIKIEYLTCSRLGSLTRLIINKFNKSSISW